MRSPTSRTRRTWRRPRRCWRRPVTRTGSRSRSITSPSRRIPEIAQAVQADLAAIGIKVQLLAGEQKQVTTKMRARQFQMTLMTWFPDYLDPHSNAQAFNYNPDDSDTSKVKLPAWRCHFHDKELTDLVDKASKELDAKKRMEMYAKMQRDSMERSPFVFLLQNAEIATMHKGVSGISARAAARLHALRGHQQGVSAKRLRPVAGGAGQRPGDAVRPDAGDVPDRPGDADRSGHRHRWRSRPAGRDRPRAHGTRRSTNRCGAVRHLPAQHGARRSRPFGDDVASGAGGHRTLLPGDAGTGHRGDHHRRDRSACRSACSPRHGKVRASTTSCG